jgi:glucosyl-3-phosphoglycerate synthase
VTGVRTFHRREFPAADVAALRGTTTVSVCLPARDEADTVGSIVATIDQHLRQDAAVVDEIIVVDDHSSDRTAEVAAAAGATVVDARSLLPEYGDGHGKGGALWKSLFASTGDLVIWCDADVERFDPTFVTGLVGVLLAEPEVQFVKGFYDRPLRDGAGGGRVTELVARPLLALLFPELNAIRQPLSGEYGGRRRALEQLCFVDGYGVDLALMIDVARAHGLGALAQVDLGERVHRNRSLAELGPQALAVLHTALHRADPDLVADKADLVRPDLPPLTDVFAERPPLVSVPGYRQHR